MPEAVIVEATRYPDREAQRVAVGAPPHASPRSRAGRGREACGDRPFRASSRSSVAASPRPASRGRT